MDEQWKRSVGDIAETLLNGKEHNRRCSLLIGAGCSVSAGIPPASGFVSVIEKAYPLAFSRANPKDYPHCMAQLFPGPRRDLIHELVEGDHVKVNLAHHAIAILMGSGFIDRVLTTNFDSLVLRACANIGFFPAVYDFAVSDIFNPGQIYGEAIFHLHGQHSGFILLNTDEEVQNNKRKLAPVFENAGSDRTWLVVGYSGENDPIFELLAEVNEYLHGLYWIGYGKGPPPDHVLHKLLETGKHACYVAGYDADKFFTELTNELGIADGRLLQTVEGWKPT